MTNPSECAVRVLCLGNDLLADDALGGVVAEQVGRRVTDSVDVVYTANTGFSLIDHLLNTRRLVVVDSILSGTGEPGDVMVLREEDARVASGSSPHYVGLFEALALARTLKLPAPPEVVIVAVEAADCTTIGGPMTARVKAAIPTVLQIVLDILASSTEDGQLWREPADRAPAAVPHPSVGMASRASSPEPGKE